MSLLTEVLFVRCEYDYQSKLFVVGPSIMCTIISLLAWLIYSVRVIIHVDAIANALQVFSNCCK